MNLLGDLPYSGRESVPRGLASPDDLGFVPHTDVVANTSLPDDLGFVPHDKETAKKLTSKLPELEEMTDTDPEAGQAARNALFDIVTGGLLPHIKAKLHQIINGEGVANDENYVTRRDAEIAKHEELAKKYPQETLAGKAVGLIAPIFMSGGGSALAEAPELVEGAAALAKPFWPAVGKSAATGAGIAAAQNPGDVPGKVDPLQATERGEAGVMGGLFGGLLGVGVHKLPAAAERLQQYGNSTAVRAAGGMLKDFRKLFSTDSLQETGEFMLEHGLVKAGDTVESVGQKASDLRNSTGDQLGALYKEASKKIETLPPEIKAKIDAAGFNPARDKAAILEAVKNDLGYAYKGDAALQGVSDYLDTLIEREGNQTLSPKVTNQIKTALDHTAITWERNPLLNDPDSQAALKTFRRILNNKVLSHIGAIGENLGDSGLEERLAELNNTYGKAALTARMAEDKAARLGANHSFSLMDRVLAAGGAAAGAHEGGSLEALIGGAATALASKTAREFGPAVVATGAKAVGKGLEKIPPASLLQQATINNAVSEGLKGRDKWAAEGFNKILQHKRDEK